MQEPNNTENSALHSTQPHTNRKSDIITARTPYPYTQKRSDAATGLIQRIKAFFSRIFSPRKAQDLISLQTLPRKKVVFRSTTSTFISPIGSYAGNNITPDLQRTVAMEQFKHNHAIPHGTTIN